MNPVELTAFSGLLTPHDGQLICSKLPAHHDICRMASSLHKPMLLEKRDSLLDTSKICGASLLQLHHLLVGLGGLLGKQQVVRHQNSAVNLPGPTFETKCSRTSSTRNAIANSMMYLVVYLVQRPLALVLDSHDHGRAVLADDILHGLHAGVQASRSVRTTRVVHRRCQAVSSAETEAAVVAHKCQSLQFVS